MGATWKNNIELTIFGESHGPCVGIVIGNFLAGISLDNDFIQCELNRRKPGISNLSSSRKEDDKFEIMSGVLNGVTTGAPITAMIFNQDIRSDDYDELKKQMRPGHSDYSAFIKYNGFNDVRGGGHFSGRLTAPLVFAGALCKLVLKQKNISIVSHIQSIGNIKDDQFGHVIDNEMIDKLQNQSFPLINDDQYSLMEQKIIDTKNKKDSIGGSVECSIVGISAGLGEPFFESIESKLASLVFSIPGVKGLHFGNSGISTLQGSECVDSYCYDKDSVTTSSNHNGGIVGGITTGMPVTFTVSIKPTASIGIIQDTIDVEDKVNTKLEIKGRHDPCIVTRVPVVVESVAAIMTLDSMRYL